MVTAYKVSTFLIKLLKNNGTLAIYQNTTNVNINLIECTAAKPDRRAISKMLEELAGYDSGTATEMTGILLDGDPIEISVDDGSVSSAYRLIRKLGIDYELIED